MKEMNRRELCGALSAFALLSGLADGQSPAPQALPTLSDSRVFHYEDLPVTHNKNGGEGRAVVKAKLVTGEEIELHQSMLPVGQMPHPPHRHNNSEFIVLREGRIAYLTDGASQIVNVGDMIYTASNKPHGMFNLGDVPARYFVVSIGEQNKATEVTLKPPPAA